MAIRPTHPDDAPATSPASKPAQRDPSPRTGGPRTEAGKNRSRSNATRHGLTAKTLLPAILGPDIIQRHKDGLRAEWQPASATEEILVGELARHAAALERAEQAENAVLRQGAQGAPMLAAMFPMAEGDPADAVLAAAFTSDALERMQRYRRLHEKAWHATLARLEAIRSKPMPAPPVVCLPVPAFITVGQCEDYLRARRERCPVPCPGCGHNAGCWLSKRRRWECAGCGRQVGMRSGTVMERSPLSLPYWFTLIRQMIIDPQCPTAKLARLAHIRRVPTVRRLATRIRQAMASDEAGTLLAGLNTVFARGP